MAIRGAEISRGVFENNLVQGANEPAVLRYMCPWALSSVCAECSAVAYDFRGFFSRFRDAFGSRPGRCMVPDDAQCDGKSPKNCRRFKSTAVTDQSLHDMSCNGGVIDGGQEGQM